uniref:Uncharacterized protein n=1 Tax=Chrysemys picta bellii TaxID=8478 RepID=A0A8C3FII0_CHRPI
YGKLDPWVLFPVPRGEWGLVVRAGGGWESGPLGSLPSSATDFLKDLGGVAFPLHASVSLREEGASPSREWTPAQPEDKDQRRGRGEEK